MRTGIAGKGVLQMADELLQIQGLRVAEGVSQGFGGIASLLNATPDDLKKVKGMGPAKRAEILAVLELARRAIAQRKFTFTNSRLLEVHPRDSLQAAVHCSFATEPDFRYAVLRLAP